MSIFASRTTDTIPIPQDPPHTAMIRVLTSAEVDKAQEVHLRATIGGRWSSRGWAAVFKRQLAQGTALAADAEKLITDPLTGFDLLTIAQAGITSWSYPEPALSPEAVADLTDDALEYFAREILRRTKPSLFQTDEEAEQVKKTASVPSIAV